MRYSLQFTDRFARLIGPRYAVPGWCAAAFVVALAGGCGDGVHVDGTINRPRNDPSNDAGSAATGAAACDVTFGVTSDEAITNLEFEVDYADVAGEFVGDGRGVRCERLLSSAYTYAEDLCGREPCVADAERKLRVQIVATGSFHAPRALLRCRFEASAPAGTDGFAIAVRDASGGGDYSQLLPQLAVTSIRCDGSTGSTTTTSTVPACDDRECPAGESCLEGACAPPGRYALEIALENETAFSALQFDVAFDCNLGSVVGDHYTTACRPQPDLNAYASFNDQHVDGQACVAREESRLSAAMIAPASLRGPVTLFTCIFQSNGRMPSLDEFTVTIVDASDHFRQPLQPPPQVSVVTIRELLR